MMDEIFNNEIARQFTSAILDKYLSPIISKTTDKFKTLYNEAKINLEIPFQSYLPTVNSGGQTWQNCVPIS